MILVVLFVMIAGLALIVFGAWWLLGAIERLGERMALRKSAPVCGILSILTVVLAIIAVPVGIEADTGYGAALAMSAWFLGPPLGVLFATLGLISRELPAGVPKLGLVGSLVFALLLIMKMFLIAI